MKIGLTYDTAPAQLELAMDMLTEIQKSMPSLEPEFNVAFTDFGDFSLGITFIYYIKKGSDNFMVQSEMNLNILRKFNAAKIEMAFPTQTIYTKKED